MINPTRTAWFFEEISGCLKLMEFQKISRFQAAIFSTTSPCCGRHFQVFLGRIPTLKTALQRKDAEMQQLSKEVRLGIGTTPASPSQHLSSSTQKVNKKSQRRLLTRKKKRIFLKMTSPKLPKDGGLRLVFCFFSPISCCRMFFRPPPPQTPQQTIQHGTWWKAHFHGGPIK